MGAELNGLSSLNDAIDDIADKWGETGEIVYRVWTPQNYAVVVEFGRGPVEAQDAEALHFTVDGEEVFVQSVGPAEPQPFMRPSVRDANRNLRTLAEDADSLDDFLARVALYIERGAKDRVSVESGALRASITSQRVK